MSATGRSDVRHPDDFYETPEWVTQAILMTGHVRRKFCDPCAGTGAILNACGANFQPWGMELDTKRAFLSGERVRKGNFLQVGARENDVLRVRLFREHDIVMNPPYNQALEFVKHACEILSLANDGENWRVHTLLRLSFLEGQKRAVWLKKNMPSHVRVLSRRPSFTHGGTDACAYAWFTWCSPDLFQTEYTSLELI